jgi:hypothetical protein
MATTEVTNNKMGNAKVTATTMQGKKRSATRTIVSSDVNVLRECSSTHKEEVRQKSVQ